MNLTLTRYADNGRATLGLLKVGNTVLYTLEDAWRDNQRNVSCIPAGTYHCVPHGWENKTWATVKRSYELTHVPGRTGILIHAGNTDADTQGCILVGLGVRVGTLTDSRKALNVLRELVGPNPFTITIRDDNSLAA